MTAGHAVDETLWARALSPEKVCLMVLEYAGEPSMTLLDAMGVCQTDESEFQVAAHARILEQMPEDGGFGFVPPVGAYERMRAWESQGWSDRVDARRFQAALDRLDASKVGQRAAARICSMAYPPSWAWRHQLSPDHPTLRVMACEADHGDVDDSVLSTLFVGLFAYACIHHTHGYVSRRGWELAKKLKYQHFHFYLSMPSRIDRLAFWWRNVDYDAEEREYVEHEAKERPLSIVQAALDHGDHEICDHLLAEFVRPSLQQPIGYRRVTGAMDEAYIAACVEADSPAMIARGFLYVLNQPEERRLLGGCSNAREVKEATRAALRGALHRATEAGATECVRFLASGNMGVTCAEQGFDRERLPEPLRSHDQHMLEWARVLGRHVQWNVDFMSDRANRDREKLWGTCAKALTRDWGSLMPGVPEISTGDGPISYDGGTYHRLEKRGTSVYHRVGPDKYVCVYTCTSPRSIALVQGSRVQRERIEKGDWEGVRFVVDRHCTIGWDAAEWRSEDGRLLRAHHCDGDFVCRSKDGKRVYGRTRSGWLFMLGPRTSAFVSPRQDRVHVRSVRRGHVTALAADLSPLFEPAYKRFRGPRFVFY